MERWLRSTTVHDSVPVDFCFSHSQTVWKSSRWHFDDDSHANDVANTATHKPRTHCVCAKCQNTEWRCWRKCRLSRADTNTTATSDNWQLVKHLRSNSKSAVLLPALSVTQGQWNHNRNNDFNAAVPEVTVIRSNDSYCQIPTPPLPFTQYIESFTCSICQLVTKYNYPIRWKQKNRTKSIRRCAHALNKSWNQNWFSIYFGGRITL